LIGAVSWAQSEIGTGQWLHDGWRALQKYQNGQYATMQDSDFLLQGMFMGYVMGTAEILHAAQWIELPKGYAPMQLCTIVGKFTDSHPEKWNDLAVGSVVRALVAVWPGKVTPHQ
jgi:hypothetical protein